MERRVGRASTAWLTAAFAVVWASGCGGARPAGGNAPVTGLGTDVGASGRVAEDRGGSDAGDTKAMDEAPSRRVSAEDVWRWIVAHMEKEVAGSVSRVGVEQAVDPAGDRLFEALTAGDAASYRAVSYRIVEPDVETYGFLDPMSPADCFYAGGVCVEIRGSVMMRAIDRWAGSQRERRTPEELGAALENLDQLLAGVMESARRAGAIDIYAYTGLTRLHLLKTWHGSVDRSRSVAWAEREIRLAPMIRRSADPGDDRLDGPLP